jgi:DNA-binding FrmR family transcriptional regulator
MKDSEKKAVKRRIARLSGQVRGLQTMIDADRDTVEILTLVAALRAALDALGALILQAQFLEAVEAIHSESVEANQCADRAFAALQRFIG